MLDFQSHVLRYVGKLNKQQYIAKYSYAPYFVYLLFCTLSYRFSRVSSICGMNPVDSAEIDRLGFIEKIIVFWIVAAEV